MHSCGGNRMRGKTCHTQCSPWGSPLPHGCSAALDMALSDLEAGFATCYLNNINKKVKENVNMPTSVKGTDHSWYVAHLANSREPGSNRVRETQAWGSSPASQPRPPHLPRLTSAHQSQPLPPPRLSSVFLQSKITYCTAEVMYNMPGFTNLKARNRLFLAVSVALPKKMIIFSLSYLKNKNIWLPLPMLLP